LRREPTLPPNLTNSVKIFKILPPKPLLVSEIFLNLPPRKQNFHQKYASEVAKPPKKQRDHITKDK